MNIKTVLCLLCILSSVACSSMKVTTEQSETFDFGSIDTYRWIDGPQEILAESDTFIDKDIQAALDSALRQRGLKIAPAEAPADIEICHYLNLREEKEYADLSRTGEPDFSGGLLYDQETRSWSYAEREPDIEIYSIEIGTLTLLLYDPADASVVWNGTLRTRIERNQTKEERQELIDMAVEKLINRLPIKTDG